MQISYFLSIVIHAKKEFFNVNSEFTITTKQKNGYLGPIYLIIVAKKHITHYYLLHSKNENLYIIKNLLSIPEIDVNKCSLEYLWANEIRGNNQNQQIVIRWKNDFLDSSKCNCLKEKFKSNTPLNISIKNQNIEIIKLLVSHPKINDNIKSIARTWCFEYYKSEKIKEIEDTPLFTSIKKNNLEILKLLLSNANIEINGKSITKSGTIEFHYQQFEEIYYKEIESTALSFSIENNQLEFVKVLLCQPTIIINCKINDRFMSFNFDKTELKCDYNMRNWIVNEITKNAFSYCN